MTQDFSVTDHGSIALLKLHSSEARSWVAENVEEGPAKWAGALVIEPRYVANIVEALEDAGLVRGTAA